MQGNWTAVTLCLVTVQVYIIEANPRASRTVPFVAKAIGHPIAKYASLLMSGKTLAELEFTEEPKLNHVAVKEAVLPFDKFPGTLRTVHCALYAVIQIPICLTRHLLSSILVWGNLCLWLQLNMQAASFSSAVCMTECISTTPHE